MLRTCMVSFGECLPCFSCSPTAWLCTWASACRLVVGVDSCGGCEHSGGQRGHDQGYLAEYGEIHGEIHGLFAYAGAPHPPCRSGNLPLRCALAHEKFVRSRSVGVMACYPGLVIFQAHLLMRVL